MAGYLPPKTFQALESLRNALYRVGLKEPWKMTGSWTNPDLLHYFPLATEYRKFAPGRVRAAEPRSRFALPSLPQLNVSMGGPCAARRTQPVKAIIPHDHPSLVYDIKYYGI